MPFVPQFKKLDFIDLNLRERVMGRIRELMPPIVESTDEWIRQTPQHSELDSYLHDSDYLSKPVGYWKSKRTVILSYLDLRLLN